MVLDCWGRANTRPRNRNLNAKRREMNPASFITSAVCCYPFRVAEEEVPSAVVGAAKEGVESYHDQ